MEAAGNSNDVYLFISKDLAANKDLTWGHVPTVSLIPAFVISELKVAFMIGFRIFLPFLIIDMLVASVLVQQTNADYLRVMGLRVVQGRFLNEAEVEAQRHSIAVNQTLVRRYFSGGEAIGRLLRIPLLRAAPLNLADDSFQIVGVVSDAVNSVSTNETLPELYLPYTIVGRADRIYALGAGRGEALAAALKAQVYAVDPGQPLMDVKTMETVLGENAYARPRFNLLLFAVFAVLGLALALLGIYGVISHAVAQQTREIGIRIALGASFRQVIVMVLGIGARLLAIGVAVGLGASLASVKLLAGLARNVSMFDPYSFAAVAVLLFAAGIFASFWPARRAARVDPMAALRDQGAARPVR